MLQEINSIATRLQDSLATSINSPELASNPILDSELRASWLELETLAETASPELSKAIRKVVKAIENFWDKKFRGSASMVKGLSELASEVTGLLEHCE